jgi:hypothetical protein
LGGCKYSGVPGTERRNRWNSIRFSITEHRETLIVGRVAVKLTGIADPPPPPPVPVAVIPPTHTGERSDFGRFGNRAVILNSEPRRDYPSLRRVRQSGYRLCPRPSDEWNNAVRPAVRTKPTVRHFGQ